MARTLTKRDEEAIQQNEDATTELDYCDKNISNISQIAHVVCKNVLTVVIHPFFRNITSGSDCWHSLWLLFYEDLFKTCLDLF